MSVQGNAVSAGITMKVVITLAVLVVAAVVASLNVAVYASAFSMLNEVLGSWVIQFIPERLRK